MKEIYENVIKPILINEIVVNWIAPIITGILVIAIPAIVLKFFRFRKDTKKINNVNDRFINSIRPYIIEKIKISSNLIIDIRRAIIMDSNIKERFVLSEIDLRNKLIMDINESKYIDEVNKKELIDFTYEIFKDFEKENELIDNKEISTREKKVNILDNFVKNPIILFFVSQIMIVLTLFFDKSGVKPEDNYAILLPLILGVFSLFSLLLDYIFKMLRSDIYESKKVYSNYEKIIYKLMLDKASKKRQEKKNSDNKN